ncbi:MAG: hypothetical protein AAF269_07060 [Pseudomonadota bacterium]
MRNSVFDYIDNLDTLLAVVIGALLATGGALVAELVQDRLGQKRRERDAARFFGEILASVDRVLDRAFASMEVGERWGDVTQRLFRTAARETAIYERNRERLFEIRDIELRRTIHTHFLVETVPLLALLEDSEEIAQMEKDLHDGSHLDDAKRKTTLDLLAIKRENREVALRSVQSAHARTEDICRQLEPIAGLSFE